MVEPPVITGWSAVSPFGVGRAAFAEGVRCGRGEDAVVDVGHLPVPQRRACLVPDFDPGELLDGKGIRYLDRASLLALVSVGELVGPGAGRDSRTGVVLGTTSGSVQSEMNIRRDSLTRPKPYAVSSQRTPSATMNCAAAQCAMRYGLTGPNMTVAGGRAAALHALVHACRLLATRRADRVLVGAVEEFSVARSWLVHHGGGRKPWLGEGSAVFRVEPPAEGRPPLAEILAAQTRVRLDEDPGAALAGCVRALLARGGITEGEVWAVVLAGGDPERQAMAELCGDVALSRVPGLTPFGDTGAASAAFGIASALSVGGDRPAATARPVVIAVSEPDGAVATALLRLPPWPVPGA
ncbi:MAG TPA: beta-ketoacyl synthase N-terminal-like domain-containing protein [Amycolatopsis sp.]|uniref:beta-ketoacyl synthase N-terminal-like domain-containing protein n=1 Tax=Amycolatopsis sp. TaxID=37632 RepID=UPI002B478DC0|nr:beta-ketoacyl synthase N-terminal-like domain-containing protein [Amycolatopsis sp.]HKS47166.1 beta-ketoacyl synthase N-terminal-like domain-containing protein [Amycolatopsis sp.]